MAGLLRRVPVVVMEPNAFPGFTNRVVGRLAARALVSFPESARHFPKGRMELTGLPVRDEFFHLPPKTRIASLDLLITGGSQGSRTLNQAARMLHHCAREIVGRHGGAFPESADAWRELPGIGRYTAAAIASIAFGEPVAVVDGNVERVLKRIYASGLPPQQCWTRAEELISHKRPGDFNQAMMELGATVCLPAGPRCPVCPVQKWCGTRADAVRELARPAKVATAGARRTGERRNGRGAGAPARRQREIWCALDERHGRVRLVKRARDASIMAGMWELPEWTTAPHTANGNALWRTFRHSITVTDYTVHVMRDAGGRAAARRGRWMALDEIQQLPITGLTRKILKAGGII